MSTQKALLKHLDVIKALQRWDKFWEVLTNQVDVLIHNYDAGFHVLIDALLTEYWARSKFYSEQDYMGELRTIDVLRRARDAGFNIDIQDLRGFANQPERNEDGEEIIRVKEVATPTSIENDIATEQTNSQPTETETYPEILVEPGEIPEIIYIKPLAGSQTGLSRKQTSLFNKLKSRSVREEAGFDSIAELKQKRNATKKKKKLNNVPRDTNSTDEPG